MKSAHEKKQRATALGERLRHRRKELGLTGKTLARTAGLSPSYLSQLEHGKHAQPSLEVLGALGTALETTIGELLVDPPIVVLPSVPAALSALAVELALDPATTTMLSGIQLDSRQPSTREGWLLVLLAIRHACAEVQPAQAATSGDGERSA
jgi:transcriptional regulator with XRE-family HTH domain